MVFTRVADPDPDPDPGALARPRISKGSYVGTDFGKPQKKFFLLAWPLYRRRVKARPLRKKNFFEAYF